MSQRIAADGLSALSIAASGLALALLSWVLTPHPQPYLAAARVESPVISVAALDGQNEVPPGR